MPKPILEITCTAILASSLALAAGCSGTRQKQSATAANSISVKAEVVHAVELNEAAVDSLIAAGLSGDREAMLFTPLTEAEYAARVREFNQAGVVTAEYVEFAEDFQSAADIWRSLMGDGLALARRAAGDERDEDMDRILNSLTNIAEANAAEDRPLVGQLIAKESLERIAELREIARQR